MLQEDLYLLDIQRLQQILFIS